MADPSTPPPGGRVLNGARLATFGVLVAVHFGLSLPALVSSWDVYVDADQAAVGYAALTANVGLIGWFVLRGRSQPAWAVRTGLVVAIAASVLLTAQVPGDQLVRQAHWTFPELGWHGVMLLIERPFVHACAFLATHLVLTAIQAILIEPPDRIAASGMLITSVITCGLQLAMSWGIKVLRRYLARADAAARERDRVLTENAVSVQLRLDRRRRDADHAADVLTVLRGLADGSLDPDDERTRRLCAVRAATLRRLFAENETSSDRLLHELRAGIDVAERGGVTVQLAVRGTPRSLPIRVRRALTDVAIAGIAAARRTARVTVIHAGQVRVSVVTDAPDIELPSGADAGVAASATHNGGKLWVEARYPVHRSSSATSPS
ncbi:hypothetical protein [Amycolatopsis aidingensis]|uniref:hypothetical protein n=1 Tax=Amycolatopsis aidingensis TaxID=2842453 RepID=UPI001C0DF3A8|nr:hypothetical protein [Amycolatopsis aidingensis]